MYVSIWQIGLDLALNFAYVHVAKSINKVVPEPLNLGSRISQVENKL